MRWDTLPAAAAWRHLEAREGFEAAFFDANTHEITGCTTAVEDGTAWLVSYDLGLDAQCRVSTVAVDTHRSGVVLERYGAGWLIDGAFAPHLDGCPDVDLESSALTNAFPVHRLALQPGQEASVPAAYVRTDLTVERLEQTYRCLEPGRYAYSAPAFDFACELRYDAAGLLLDYPGIAVRAA